MQVRRVAVIEGFRTPFTRVFTDFREMTAIDLAKVCLAELVNRTEIDPDEIDEIETGIPVRQRESDELGRRGERLVLLRRGDDAVLLHAVEHVSEAFLGAIGMAIRIVEVRSLQHAGEQRAFL